MLRHVTAPTRFFSQTPNDIIRHPRLNGTAVRLLQWALSLPDGARETIQSLGQKMPEGRAALRTARQQLEAEGFVHTRRSQDPVTGKWSTQVLVSNVSLTTPAEVDAAFAAPGGGNPTVGQPAVRALGASPKGDNTKENNTSHPGTSSALRPEEPAEPARPDWAVRGAYVVARIRRKPPEPLLARAASLLHSLGRREAKLALGVAEAARLAPLAAQWFANGASELELRTALASGLPPAVHSPAGFLTRRLRDKLPAPRPARDPAAPALPECTACGDPLPPDQATGLCTPCTGAAPAPPPPPGLPGPALARAAIVRRRLPRIPLGLAV
ncbi:hypothetical protein ACFXJ5_08100 [Streptomyces sp. NPDC059373]